MDDIDFKAKVSRAEFEELCADLFERVAHPVQDALASAEMTMVSSLLSTCYHFSSSKCPTRWNTSHDEITFKMYCTRVHFKTPCRALANKKKGFRFSSARVLPNKQHTPYAKEQLVLIFIQMAKRS